MIQIAAHKPATGHAINQRRASQRIAKIGFDAIVTV
jgi:hypothetical protein